MTISNNYGNTRYVENVILSYLFHMVQPGCKQHYGGDIEMKKFSAVCRLAASWAVDVGSE
jgi:hypothetical protein